MQMELIVALVLVLPIILLMAVFVWYLNIGGLSTAVKNSRRKNTVTVETADVELVREFTAGRYGARVSKPDSE